MEGRQTGAKADVGMVAGLHAVCRRVCNRVNLPHPACHTQNNRHGDLENTDAPLPSCVQPSRQPHPQCPLNAAHWMHGTPTQTIFTKRLPSCLQRSPQPHSHAQRERYITDQQYTKQHFPSCLQQSPQPRPPCPHRPSHADGRCRSCTHQESGSGHVSAAGKLASKSAPAARQ